MKGTLTSSTAEALGGAAGRQPQGSAKSKKKMLIQPDHTPHISGEHARLRQPQLAAPRHGHPTRRSSSARVYSPYSSVADQKNTLFFLFTAMKAAQGHRKRKSKKGPVSRCFLKKKRLVTYVAFFLRLKLFRRGSVKVPFFPHEDLITFFETVRLGTRSCL